MSAAPSMTHAQLTRMIWIDARTVGAGTLNRADIMEAFGVSTAQAAVDIRQYRCLNPSRLKYNSRAKTYQTRKGSSPAFTATERLAVTHAAKVVASNLTKFRLES